MAGKQPKKPKKSAPPKVSKYGLHSAIWDEELDALPVKPSNSKRIDLLERQIRLLESTVKLMAGEKWPWAQGYRISHDIDFSPPSDAELKSRNARRLYFWRPPLKKAKRK